MRVVPLFAVLVPLLALAGPSPDARITLKTHGTLRDVAERIASEGKLSVVVRVDLDEDAEVYFQNVPADEALETLARAYGLSLEKRGNIYTLRPHAEGSPPMGARSSVRRAFLPDRQTEHGGCSQPPVPSVAPGIRDMRSSSQRRRCRSQATACSTPTSST